jgi:hypothetical protein
MKNSVCFIASKLDLLNKAQIINYKIQCDKLISKHKNLGVTNFLCKLGTIEDSIFKKVLVKSLGDNSSIHLFLPGVEVLKKFKKDFENLFKSFSTINLTSRMINETNKIIIENSEKLVAIKNKNKDDEILNSAVNCAKLLKKELELVEV